MFNNIKNILFSLILYCKLNKCFVLNNFIKKSVLNRYFSIYILYFYIFYIFIYFTLLYILNYITIQNNKPKQYYKLEVLKTKTKTVLNVKNKKKTLYQNNFIFIL